MDESHLKAWLFTRLKSGDQVMVARGNFHDSEVKWVARSFHEIKLDSGNQWIVGISAKPKSPVIIYVPLDSVKLPPSHELMLQSCMGLRRRST